MPRGDGGISFIRSHKEFIQDDLESIKSEEEEGVKEEPEHELTSEDFIFDTDEERDDPTQTSEVKESKRYEYEDEFGSGETKENNSDSDFDEEHLKKKRAGKKGKRLKREKQAGVIYI